MKKSCHSFTKIGSGLLLLLSLSVLSCRKGGLLPRSGGQLYEVLLVGDQGGIVHDALSADVDGLPQPEPCFDVSDISRHDFGSTLHYTRNIVLVDINPDVYTRPSIRSERNVWAQPQTVVHIGAPTADALRSSIDSIGRRLRHLLNLSETRKQLSILRHERNTKAEKVIRQMFGIDLWIPADMTASKRGKDFLWMSNNSATTMQNIVVYRDWCRNDPSKGQPMDKYESAFRRFLDARNYMLGHNILGETDSMHMATVPESILTDSRGGYRGLWMMTNDAMGGPFVSRSLPMRQGQTQGRYTCQRIVVEGFVFAPGKSKRNAIRRLEAVLCTMKENNK